MRVPTTAAVAAMGVVAVATAATSLGKKIFFVYFKIYVCPYVCVSESWVIFFIIIK